MIFPLLACIAFTQATTPIGPVQTAPIVVEQVAGSGRPVAKGDLVTVQFVISKAGGADVADSKKRGLPYRFRVADKGNDPLLDLVATGMKPGGKRMVTIWGKAAYGPEGIPNVVAPSDKLIVVMSLLRRD